jgi:hypothetical protein
VPDLPIVLPDTAAAPKDYTLSGTQELLLKTVRALIDGSGAATAFLPTLQLLDPNGHVMWEGATTDTVAAGGSADVSWFPGLGAGGGATTTNAEWFIARRTSNLTMAPGVQTSITWTDLHSSDSSLFSLSGSDVHVTRQGVVLFQVWAKASGLEPNFVMEALCNSTNGVSSNTNTPQNQYNTLGLPSASAPGFGPEKWAIQIPDVVPFDLQGQVINYDAVNRVMADAQMWGLWWPIATLSPF